MNDKKARMQYLIISGVILVLISGLRSYFIGSGDTSRYAMMFEEDVRMSFQQILDSGIKDPFYHVFSKALTFVVGNNFQAILTIFAIIFITAYSNLVQKESPDLLLSYIVFFAMGFFNFSMHGARQAMAIAFVLFSYFPLKESKLLRFLTLVFIAACFHKTAAIFVIAYPFCKFGFTKQSAYIYLGLIVLLMFWGDSLIHGFVSEISVYDENFSGYIDIGNTLTYSGFIQLCLFFTLVIINLRRFREKDPNASMLITLLILAMIFQLFSVFIAEMFRVAVYFSSFLVILVPRLLKTYPPSKRKTVTYMLCTLLMIYFYILYPSNLRYDFFWNN